VGTWVLINEIWYNPPIWSGLTLPVSLKLCTQLIGMLMPPKLSRRLMQRQAAFDNRLRHTLAKVIRQSSIDSN